ncbi:SRPBCC family protein [Algoriphagus resistens]|uniref:SRPBCC family protein n=1 Tax=Algoriphagus resistens TaxID=1750590 RepID=UPI0007169233|nr:SRPBCC domain-containing protein [Algoriphagus resistens]
MEQKTKIKALDGQQELFITREFDLPIDLLFKAYVVPELVAEWMGTKVLKLDSKRHGSYQFETTDPKGNQHRFNGVIHEFEANKKITRTFEMENTLFPVQLEFLEFTPLSDERSRLTMQVIYKSVKDRDEHLKMPFALGINMAHDRIQEICNTLKQ